MAQMDMNMIPAIPAKKRARGGGVSAKKNAPASAVAGAAIADPPPGMDMYDRESDMANDADINYDEEYLKTTAHKHQHFKMPAEIMNQAAIDDVLSTIKTLEERIHQRVGKYIEVPWTILGSYFKDCHLKQLVRHQVESYNNFVNEQIQKTISMFNPVNIMSEQDYDKQSKKHKLEIEVTFEKFHIYRPQIHENNGATKMMFPQEARLRNFTYSSTMTIDLNIKYIVRTGDNLENVQTFYKTIPKVHIGKLPIMLKSSICVLNQHQHISTNITGECSHDAGGYFIINGSEKTVLGQERAAENKVYCFNVGKANNKWSWSAEIKSVPDFKCISPKQINMMISAKNSGFGYPIFIQIPRIKQPLPLFVVFRALGVVSDMDICRYICLDIHASETKPILDFLQGSIVDCNTIMTQEDALKCVTQHVIFTPINMDKESGAKKKREFALDVLNNDLFPHCNSHTQRVYFLAYMAGKLIRASFDPSKQDDRDSYSNKRVDLTGALLNNLFRNYFNKLVKDMMKQIVREINTGSWRSTEDYLSIVNQTNVYKIIKSTTIENGLKRALSTGDFGIKNVANSNKVGVAQVLNRLTYVSSLSHLRRINTPIDKSGKLIPPRKLHNTSWGFLCPAETPEGGSVGVVKNISYMTHVTISSNSESLHTQIEPYIVRVETLGRDNLADAHDKVKVFVNGAWVGITHNPQELYEDFKDKKHRGIINVYTSVIFDLKALEIRICNDAGRLMRPVLRVKDNDLFITNDIITRLQSNELTWDDLLTDTKNPSSIIEYIDPEEQSYSMIAMRPRDLYACETESAYMRYKYTHCEIHPSTIFGILASCIPFPEHNQAPRNTYQCLDPRETVLMADGKRRMIRDVCVGDQVVTFHPVTMKMSVTTVVRQFVRPSERRVYRITTLSGREIVATEDHKFMTNKGWMEVGHIAAAIRGASGNHLPAFKDASLPADTHAALDLETLKNVPKIGIVPAASNLQIWPTPVSAYVQKKMNAEITMYGGKTEAVSASSAASSSSSSDDDQPVIMNLNPAVNGNGQSQNQGHCIESHIELELVNSIERHPGMSASLDDLKAHAVITPKGECMFVPVQSIVEVSARMVSDITVHSDNHSFIAGNGGFLSSNCAMGKQAMGVYVTNYENRMDKTAYVMTYPMRPLVDTRLMGMIQLDKIPSGAPLMVAIMTHTGYNQEDSVLVNKGSIDRGMFLATIYHTEKDEEKRINGDEEIRCKPDPAKTKGMKFGNYDKINSRGVIPENTLVENRDIIIAKVIPIKENRNDHTKVVKYEDLSRSYRTAEESYIDKNYIERNGEGYCFCKTRIRTLRKPVIGDKVSSRMGQKGTVGNIIPECDMPYTKEGVRPDIIINPHAIPSRMTIGQLKETLLGKVLVNLGLFGDGTSFGNLDIKDISKELLKIGFEKHGNELLYNGLTGQQIESNIFIGPVFYQRLKHMVNDKQHSRSIGPMVNLTRQPAEGRSRDGGLRFGEMERDATVSHGAARFTRGRLYDSSDKYEAYVCRKCGMIAAYNAEIGIHLCKTCENRVDFALVQIPYACKLLFQELQTMNIAPRIMT